jgi:hypothetical protein
LFVVLSGLPTPVNRAFLAYTDQACRRTIPDGEAG